MPEIPILERLECGLELNHHQDRIADLRKGLIVEEFEILPLWLVFKD